MNNRRRLLEGFSTNFEKNLIDHITENCSEYQMGTGEDKDSFIDEMEVFASQEIRSKSNQEAFNKQVTSLIIKNEAWDFGNDDDIADFVKHLKKAVNINEINVSEAKLMPVWVASQDAGGDATIFNINAAASDGAEKISNAVSDSVDEDQGTFKVINKDEVDGMFVITTEHVKEGFKDVIILGGKLRFNSSDKPLLEKALKKALGNDYEDFDIVGAGASEALETVNEAYPNDNWLIVKVSKFEDGGKLITRLTDFNDFFFDFFTHKGVAGNYVAGTHLESMAADMKGFTKENYIDKVEEVAKKMGITGVTVEFYSKKKFGEDKDLTELYQEMYEGKVCEGKEPKFSKKLIEKITKVNEAGIEKQSAIITKDLFIDYTKNKKGETNIPNRTFLTTENPEKEKPYIVKGTPIKFWADAQGKGFSKDNGNPLPNLEDSWYELTKNLDESVEDKLPNLGKMELSDATKKLIASKLGKAITEIVQVTSEGEKEEEELFAKLDGVCANSDWKSIGEEDGIEYNMDSKTGIIMAEDQGFSAYFLPKAKVKEFMGAVSEAKVDKGSVTFSGRPNVSSNLNARAGQFQIWLNGGNAFEIKSDPELLKKLELKGEAVENVQAKLMDVVVKALEDNFEKIVKEEAN